MLPEGWKIFRGEEIAQKITKGQSPKWQGFEYQKDGAIFITSENVRDGFLDISKPKFLPIEFSNKIKGSQLKKGDVLINLVGASIGRSCLYEKNLPHANINQAVCTFRTNSHADPHFLALFFQHPKTIDRLICGQNASARQNISLGDIKNFEILLPPLPEQKKIAAILSTWDRAIEGTEKLLANSQQQKKALMQQLLTGKKRLPGFTGEWKTHRLSDIAKLGTGNTAPQESHYFSESGHDFLRVSDLGSSTGRWAPVSRDKITLQAIDDHRMSPAPSGATLFTKSGASLLLNQRAQITYDTYIVGHLGYAKAKKGYCDNYLFYILSEIDFSKIASGTSLPALKISDLGKTVLHIPSLSEQQAIAAVLTTADEEITAIEADLTRLRQEKKALMQQLLTGKRRVKVD